VHGVFAPPSARHANLSGFCLAGAHETCVQDSPHPTRPRVVPAKNPMPVEVAYLAAPVNGAMYFTCPRNEREIGNVGRRKSYPWCFSENQPPTHRKKVKLDRSQLCKQRKR